MPYASKPNASSWIRLIVPGLVLKTEALPEVEFLLDASYSFLTEYFVDFGIDFLAESCSLTWSSLSGDCWPSSPY